MQINYISPFGNTGYGIVGKNLFKALHNAGCDIIPHPIGTHMVPDSQEDRVLFEEQIKRREYFHIDGHCLRIWHENQLAERVGNGQYLAYPFFEIDRFTGARLHHIKAPDKILVSSKWAKDIVEQYRNNVHIVNPGVDTNIFKPENLRREEDSPYTFIVTGKWEKRKGHDIIPECFRRAFISKDNVRLLMYTYNPFNSELENKAWRDRYLNCGLGDKISFVEKESGPHQNIARAINSADCGIYISRAEGWNMELLETMACGKPVIATFFSAHTEYANKDNALLVDIEETEAAYDGKWFFGEGEWAHLGEDQIDQIIEYMRYCYQNRPTNQDGIETAKRYSWASAANQVIRCINSQK